jgi:hypothetical protein
VDEVRCHSGVVDIFGDGGLFPWPGSAPRSEKNGGPPVQPRFPRVAVAGYFTALAIANAPTTTKTTPIIPAVRLGLGANRSAVIAAVNAAM